MSAKTLPAPVPRPASLKSLREAVIGLGERGTREVSVVRQAFVTGAPPVQTFSSGSKSDFINRFGGTGVSSEIAKSTAQFGLHSAVVTAPLSPPRAELDFVEVGSDRSFGVLDSFFARVVFSLPISDVPKVSYIRVLRAVSGRIEAPTPSFSALAESTPLGHRTKSTEFGSNSAFRIAGIGVGNALTNSVKDDTFSSQRSVVASSSLRPIPPAVNTNRRGGTPAGLVSIANGDRSVLENITFYVNQRTLSPRKAIEGALTAGRRSGLNVLMGSAVGSSTSIVSVGNSMGFSEVARIPVTQLRQVGAIAEFEYWDPSVIYGAGYSYYVVAVSPTGVPSVRSRIVSVPIVRTIPPPTPRILFAVLGNSPRFTAFCSGSFIDHIEVFRRGGTVPSEVSLLSTPRSMIDRGPPASTDTGFYHIGDVGIGSSRSSNFVDRGVSPGQVLEYRFYAVDSFGLKCSTPFSCSITMPDVGRSVPIGIPSITVEQAPGDRIVKVSVSCEDPRVTSFMLSRRELKTGERSFRQPTDPAYFTFGSTTVKRARSRSGPKLSQFSSNAWSGVLSATTGSAQFTDTSVELDRVYQYSVRGVDVRGNQTADVTAPPVFVAAKPIAERPTDLTGTVLVDSTGAPSGVSLQWTPGTIDFSPTDLIGDQNVLAASSRRSLFQIERRALGKSNWEMLPAITGTSMVDPVSSLQAPKFRPGYAEVNRQYDYRVIAMQSGAFISTHSDPIRVAITPEIQPPGPLVARSSSTAIRPVFVVLSWQYDGIFVDSWEIQRAVTNKVFGARVPSMDSALARSLDYSDIAKVTRESSRGLGVSSDGRALDRGMFAGNRSFIDRDVSMANSYFYRVRAVDAIGRPSNWSYSGIFLTDSPFDRKFMSSLSDSDKSALALDPRPLSGWSSR